MDIDGNGGVLGQISRFYDKITKSVDDLDKKVDDLKNTGEKLTNEIVSFVVDSDSTNAKLKNPKDKGEKPIIELFNDEPKNQTPKK